MGAAVNVVGDDGSTGRAGYRRSTGSPRGEARRRELLDRVTDDLAVNGLVDFSLRRAARAAGTTHKVLLYHFDGRTVNCLDTRTLVEPFDDQRSRWRLPCGGATLTVHLDWGLPRRLVVRCDDARGVFIQRDG